MPKNLTFAVFALLLAALGCSLFPSSGWMDAKKSADNLMSVVRDGDYARAAELMNNDGGKPSAQAIENLKKKIESDNLQPQSWTLEEQHISDPVGDNSYSIITGKVVFKNGTNGSLSVRAEAFGMRKNPWRFSNFELKR